MTKQTREIKRPLVSKRTKTIGKIALGIAGVAAAIYVGRRIWDSSSNDALDAIAEQADALSELASLVDDTTNS